MSDRSRILFIFEGEKTEKLISESFSKSYFLDGNEEIITTAFCGEIYQLYKQLLNDEFELDSLDIFPIVKEIPQNKEILKNYNRDDFSEIYLFFDYDPHATQANDKKVFELLSFFNEETDRGKIFISYPMIESIKCFNERCGEDCFYTLSFEAAKCKSFKQFASNYASNKYNQVKKLTKVDWDFLVRINLQKANIIVGAGGGFPESIISEESILNSQVKMKSECGRVSVLNSFPMMLASYFGMGKLRAKIGFEMKPVTESRGYGHTMEQFWEIMASSESDKEELAEA